MRLAALALALLPLSVAAQSEAQTESLEVGGHLGSRPTILVLHASRIPDAGWQIAGEYIVLTTLQRRFLEGEASPEIRVTTLREGNSPILFGRSPTGELRGTWRNGVFRGARFAPGGQERERFEFTEEFPSLEKYSASVRCEAHDARYSSTLNLAVEAGKLQSLEWRSKVSGSDHACAVTNVQQQPLKGGLRFVSGKCAVTLREVGDFVWLSANECTELCGSQAYLEPVVIDHRGHCRLLRPEAKQ
jgi:hypothetical protein